VKNKIRLTRNHNIYYIYTNDGNDIIHSHRDVYRLESPTTNIRKVYSEKSFDFAKKLIKAKVIIFCLLHFRRDNMIEILPFVVIGMFVEHFLGIAGKITEITYNYIKSKIS